MKMTTAALLAILATMTACETTEGLGRDTEKLGDNIEGAAEKHDLDNDPNE
jgi:predicted small secreted protein